MSGPKDRQHLLQDIEELKVVLRGAEADRNRRLRALSEEARKGIPAIEKNIKEVLKDIAEKEAQAVAIHKRLLDDPLSAQPFTLVVKPCQARKTQEAFNIILEGEGLHNSKDTVHIIISDNYIAQSQQLTKRLRDELITHYKEQDSQQELGKEAGKDPWWAPIDWHSAGTKYKNRIPAADDIRDLIKANGKRYITTICNKTRMEGIHEALIDLVEDPSLNFNIYLDEADVTYPVWLGEFGKLIKKHPGRIQVFFITATPLSLFQYFTEALEKKGLSKGPFSLSFNIHPCKVDHVASGYRMVNSVLEDNARQQLIATVAEDTLKAVKKEKEEEYKKLVEQMSKRNGVLKASTGAAEALRVKLTAFGVTLGKKATAAQMETKLAEVRADIVERNSVELKHLEELVDTLQGSIERAARDVESNITALEGMKATRQLLNKGVRPGADIVRSLNPEGKGLHELLKEPVPLADRLQDVLGQLARSKEEYGMQQEHAAASAKSVFQKAAEKVGAYIELLESARAAVSTIMKNTEMANRSKEKQEELKSQLKALEKKQDSEAEGSALSSHMQRRVVENLLQLTAMKRHMDAAGIGLDENTYMFVPAMNESATHYATAAWISNNMNLAVLVINGDGFTFYKPGHNCLSPKPPAEKKADAIVKHGRKPGQLDHKQPDKEEEEEAAMMGSSEASDSAFMAKTMFASDPPQKDAIDLIVKVVNEKMKEAQKKGVGLAVTGYRCIGRAITMQSKDLQFTHALFVNQARDSRLFNMERYVSDVYQLVARVAGCGLEDAGTGRKPVLVTTSPYMLKWSQLFEAAAQELYTRGKRGDYKMNYEEYEKMVEELAERMEPRDDAFVCQVARVVRETRSAQ